jgi:hypothetical protein
LPVKNDVSTTTPRTTPAAPSRTIAASCPVSRRRRVSHPSYVFPLLPYAPDEKTGESGRMRFSRSAKNSSVASTTLDPRRREARSGNAVKSSLTCCLW